MKIFTPTLRFRRFTEVTPERLRQLGVSAVLTDLDDTLAPRNVFLPDEEVRRWINTIAAAGIRVAIVSNNHEKRARTFAEPLGIPWVSEAKKPGKKAIQTMLRTLNAKPEETVLLGDQLFTDVTGAHRCGLRVILVDPVGTYGGWFVQLKRKLEIPLRKKIPYTETLPDA